MATSRKKRKPRMHVFVNVDIESILKKYKELKKKKKSGTLEPPRPLPQPVKKEWKWPQPPREPGPRPEMPRVIPDWTTLLDDVKERLISIAEETGRYDDKRIINEVYERVKKMAAGKDKSWVRVTASSLFRFFRRAWNLGAKINLDIRGPCVASTSPVLIGGGCKSLMLCDSHTGLKIMEDPRPESECKTEKRGKEKTSQGKEKKEKGPSIITRKPAYPTYDPNMMIKAKYLSERYGIPLEWFRQRHTQQEIYEMAKKIAEKERQKRIEMIKEYASKLGQPVIEHGGTAFPQTVEKLCMQIGSGYVIFQDRITQCKGGEPINHAMLPDYRTIAMSLGSVRLPPEPLYKSPMLNYLTDRSRVTRVVDGKFVTCLRVSPYAYREWAKEYGEEQLKREARAMGFKCIEAGDKIIMTE